MDDPATLLSGDEKQIRVSALRKYEEISRAFTFTFETSEPKAYGDLLKNLMDNASLFIAGQIMTAKEVLDKIEDLQIHLKKSGGAGGRTMADMFYDWLNGGDDARRGGGGVGITP